MWARAAIALCAGWRCEGRNGKNILVIDVVNKLWCSILARHKDFVRGPLALWG